MAIFIIYTNLNDNETEWKKTLNHLRDYKHQVHLIGDSAAKIKKNLFNLMEDCTSIICHNEDKNTSEQVKTIKKCYEANDNIIVTMEDCSTQMFDGIPNVMGYELTHKNLRLLSHKFRRSNSIEFEELQRILTSLDLQYYSKETQIVPLKNIAAQREFIAAVCMYADTNPDTNMYDCLLVVKAQYERINRLKDVISAPANLPLFGSGLFAKILRGETEVGILLRKAESTVQEIAENKAKLDREKLTTTSLHYQQI